MTMEADNEEAAAGGCTAVTSSPSLNADEGGGGSEGHTNPQATSGGNDHVNRAKNVIRRQASNSRKVNRPISRTNHSRPSTGKYKKVVMNEFLPTISSQSSVGYIEVATLFEGQFGLLFSAPRAFDAVFASELHAMMKLKKEFDARKCEIVAVTVESVKSIEVLLQDLEKTQQVVVNFPILADEKGDISRTLLDLPPDMTKEEIKECMTSGLVVVDLYRRVRLQMSYPSTIGRNFYEVLRTLDAIQLNMFHKVNTPSNWMQGEHVFISPEIGEKEATRAFPRGFHSVLPYMRITLPPDEENIEEEEGGGL